MNIQYYKINSRKVTYAEYWRLSPGLGFFVAAIAKLFHQPINFKSGVPRIDSLVRMDSETFSGGINSLMDEKVSECLAQGLQLKFYYTIPMLGQSAGYAAAFLSLDGLITAQVMFSQSKNANTTVQVTALSLMTRLISGRYLAAGDQPKRFVSPPWVEAVSMPGRKTSEILLSHRERVSSCSADKPVPIAESELEKFIIDVNNRSVDFNVQRGVYVLMNEDEVREMK